MVNFFDSLIHTHIKKKKKKLQQFLGIQSHETNWPLHKFHLIKVAAIIKIIPV